MHFSAQSKSRPPVKPKRTPSLDSTCASRLQDAAPNCELQFKRKGPVLWRLPAWLGTVLLATAFTLSAHAQSSVTLAWDPDADNTVAGYRLYEGVASRTYTNIIDVGNVTAATISNLVWGVTYYFAITAYDTNGQESALSDEISFTVPFPSDTNLTFAADSGTFTDPFADSSGSLSQAMTTGVTNGGRAVYSFNIIQAGDYLVTAEVIAPSLSENTFYVNIDAEPTDPLMIWDIPVCSTMTSQTVSWRGNGDGDPASDQYSPNVFTLGVGPHQLVIRGQDANAMLGAISIVPAQPALSISLAPAADETSVILSVTGGPGQTASILSSEDIVNWTPLGTVTLDASGSADQTVSGLSIGSTYFFRATAYDTNGLESESSNEVSYTVPGPTNTPPAIALTWPADGASFAAPASISLAASVTEYGHAITKVQFYNGADLLSESAVAPYSFVWDDVGEGSYSLSAVAVYDSGSTVGCAPVNVTVTSVPLPSVALISPADGASFAAPASISLAASVTEYGHAITKVQFYNGADLLSESAVAPYSFVWDDVGEGSYSLSAVAVYDSGSTVGCAPVNVTVTSVPLPSVALISPADGASFAAPASISLAASVTEYGHAITKVQFYNGADLLAEVAAAPYSFVWNDVGEGSYSLSALAVYDSGSAVSSPVANVTVTAIKAPHLDIYKGPGQAASQVILSVTAGDPGQSYNVQSSPDLMGWTVIGALTLDAAGSCQFTNSAPGDGSNCFYRLEGQ